MAQPGRWPLPIGGAEPAHSGHAPVELTGVRPAHWCLFSKRRSSAFSARKRKTSSSLIGCHLPPFLESTEPRDCLTVLQLNRETCRRNSADIHGQRLAFGIWDWFSKRYGDGVAVGLGVGTLVWDGGSATRGGTTGSPLGWRSFSGYAFGIGKPSGPMGTSITMSLLLGTRGRPSWS